MTASTTRLIAILATAAGLLTANPAIAKNSGNNGNHSHSNQSNSISLSFKSSPIKSNPGFSNQLKKTTVISNSKPFSNPKPVVVFKKDNCDSHDCHKPCFDGHCYPKYPWYPTYGCIRTIYCEPFVNCLAYEPFHSTYIVLPGDSFYTVSLKEYGTSRNWQYIAQFNRLAVNLALVPGQQLMLPSISANGALSVSLAPAAGSDIAALSSAVNAQVNITTATTTPAASMISVAPEPSRTKVAVGSTLLVDGQSFGEKSGAARLRVSGLSLPIEVLEWTAGAVKIRLPQVEITSSTAADIEVLRADGSLASKTAVDLTTATVQVALGK